ncbi:50S ribosomal protein L35 [Candidatus Peregrinibacteria bacterium]|nr:50S ribosomal protein L35 [Candidatus Peregrinibacteria bacterium]
MTGSGKYGHNKAAHNHLLQQKSKKQKRAFGHTMTAPAVYNKQLKRMLPGM